MTYLLCRWLNKEIRLSQVIEPKSFVRDFSNGYLIGEILHKYHLQNDFNMFINDTNSSSKMNNFRRLEPTLQVLGISFDRNTSQGLMQGKQGVATHLLYQLYVTLENKKKGNISGTVTYMVPTAASVCQCKKEQDTYSVGLHKGLRLNPDLKLDKISHHNEDKGQQLNHKSIEVNVAQQKKPLPVKEQKKERNINMTTSIRTARFLQNQQKQQRKEKQAQEVQNEIHQFEANTRKQFTSTTRDFPLEEYGPLSEAEAKSGQQFNSQYIQQIRLRLEVEAFTQKQREKREAQFLVEHFKARKSQQDTEYEEYLVKHLTRQTKEEERLVAQLLQVRSQKEVLLKNSLYQQQQIQKRREKDFQEALEREAALARQERLEQAEEMIRALDICKNLAAERKQNRYEKHFKSCKEIMEQIVDLATKAGDYHLLTGTLIPGKQMREWKELLFRGLPLYETLDKTKDHEDEQLDPVKLMKQGILNNHDYKEYRDMVGEWAWPEAAGQIEKRTTNNNIFDHVIVRLRKIVHLPAIKQSEPPFPHFCLKACVLGKACSGKTTCLAKIAQAHGFYVLSTDKLITEVLSAYHNREEVSKQQEKFDKGNPSTEENEGLPDKITDTKLSRWAMFGAAADKVMREGKAIPSELLVDMITEAIREIPANSCWVLDGFPVDITQAYLLEKALGGAVDEVTEVANNRIDLTGDSDPPKAPQAPALDLALLLEITDECVASRAANQSDENKLPVISNRIAAFEDTWLELEEWFGTKQNILVHVNANVVEEELFRAVESILQRVRKQPPEVLNSGIPLETSSAATAAVDHEEALIVPDYVESCSSLNIDQEESRSLKEPSLTNDNDFSVDETLPPGLAASLCLHWDTVCKSYVNKIKVVLQELRFQRNTVDQHLFNIREEVERYLGRSDLKQDLLSQWQKDFNVIPLEQRKKEETKAELHQRLDDLLEQLWDNSDKRREENEEKMAAVMEAGWSVDHITIVLKHHSTLVQLEVEHFQDTLCFLKTYYQSMCKQTLPKTPESECVYNLHIQDESMMSKTHSQGQTEPGELHHENLISDYEEALSTINNMILAEAQQTKQPVDGEEEKGACPGSDKNSSPPSNQESSHEPSDIKHSESTVTNRKIQIEIYAEYAAALNQQGDAAKMRVALIKGHGLKMVDSLQSRAEQIFISMKQLVKEHFAAEMMSIDHVAEVVRLHIESDPKLQNKLVLDCSYVDAQLKTTPPPSPSQPVLEAHNTTDKE